MALAQTNRLGRDFNKFVVLDEFNAVFQRQLDRWRNLDRVFLAGNTEVGQLLGTCGVDHQIVVTAVDTHNHAFVDGIVGTHKHSATIIQLAQRVSENFPGIHRNQHAVLAPADVTLVRLVAIEDVGNQARAARQVQEFIGKSDQATRRDAVLQAHAAAAVRLHAAQFTFAFAQSLHHAALVLVFDVDGHQFDWLVLFTVHFFHHDARLADCQFVTLAAHVFQQNGQVQLSATHDFEDTFFAGFLDAQGHIVL